MMLKHLIISYYSCRDARLCIPTPLFWIIYDVFRNSMEGIFVTDNVMVKTGLPLKIGLDNPGIFGYPNFRQIHFLINDLPNKWRLFFVQIVTK